MEIIWASVAFSFIIGTAIVGAAWILQTRPKAEENKAINALVQHVCKTGSESQDMLDRANDRLLAFTDEGREYRRMSLELAALNTQLEQAKERARTAAAPAQYVTESPATSGPRFRDGAAVETE